MPVRMSPSGPTLDVLLPDLEPIASGRILGRPRTALPDPGPVIAMTGAETAGILDQVPISWAATQRWLAAMQLGTQQNESGALPSNVVLNNTTNRFYYLINGDGEIQTLTPASGVTDVGRWVKVYIVGSGIKRVRHAFSGGGVGRIQCPSNADMYLGNRGSFDLIGDGANGWLMVNPSLGAVGITLSVVVPAVAAGTLTYLDVSLAATGLAGIAAGQPVIVQPQVDLAAAGAASGYFVGARVSATNNLRMTFFGTLAGGAANFTIVKVAA